MIELDKIFIELRYPEELLFDDRKILKKISKDSSDYFSNFKFNQNNNSLSLINNDKYLNANIFNNRMVINMNEPSFYQGNSLEKFKEICIKMSDRVVNELELEQIDRIGIRAMWAYDVKDINESIELIEINFLDSDFLNVFLEKNELSNTSVSFSLNRNNIGTNIKISHNTSQKIEIRGRELIENENKEFLGLDIDVYIDNPIKSSEIKSYLKKLVSYQNRRVDQLKNIIKD